MNHPAMKTLSSTLLALGLAASSHSASAAAGFSTCQGFQSDSRRTLYTRPFAAESGAEDGNFTQFVAKLKSDGYVKDFSKFTGICIWEKSARDAEVKTERYTRHFTEQGASSMGVDFAATPAPPTEDLAKVRAAVEASRAYGWCSLTDFEKRKVYFTDLYSYTGDIRNTAEHVALFKADLVKRFGPTNAEPVCHATFSEDYEKSARQNLIDQYKDMVAITRSGWKAER